MFTVLVIKLFRLFPARIRERLWLTYNSRDIVDGTGSQLQRILSIYLLSRYIGCSYKHTGVEDVTVTPLDPFYEQSEIQNYVVKMNNYFGIEDTKEGFSTIDILKTCEIRSPKLSTFVSCLFRLALNKDINIMLKITVPYKIVDFLEFNSSHFESILKRLSKIQNLPPSESTLVIHLRWGWGREITAPGESSPRILPLSYFAKAIDYMKGNARKEGGKIDRILIITDAPDKPLFYQPSDHQLSRWDSTNILDGRTYISPLEDADISKLSHLPIEVVRGGCPIEAIATMTQARHLILSKSSLGYLSALLNPNANVLYPPQFWHRKQSHWSEIDQWVAIS